MTSTTYVRKLSLPVFSSDTVKVENTCRQTKIGFSVPQPDNGGPYRRPRSPQTGNSGSEVGTLCETGSRANGSFEIDKFPAGAVRKPDARKPRGMRGGCACVVPDVIAHVALRSDHRETVTPTAALAFSFQIDPTVRHTWWSLMVGGAFTYVSVYGTNQVQVQRYLTMKDYGTVVRTLWFSWPITAFLSLCMCFAGLAVFTKYRDCDPIKFGTQPARTTVPPRLSYVRACLITRLAGRARARLCCSQGRQDIHRGPADAAVRAGHDGPHGRPDRPVPGGRVLVRAVLRVRGPQLAGRRHARGLRDGKSITFLRPCARDKPTLTLSSRVAKLNSTSNGRLPNCVFSRDATLIGRVPIPLRFKRHRLNNLIFLIFLLRKSLCLPQSKL